MRRGRANSPLSGRLLARFLADTSAATAIEYALIAAGVSVAIAGTVWSLGTTIQDTLYNKINAAIK